MKTSTLEARFDQAWRLCRPVGMPDPVPEHRFAPPRRWRFDRAWPSEMVAVELEGGVWTAGRHTRGAGFLGDLEKLNAAVVLGWRVLRYAADDLRTRPAAVVDEIVGLLRGRRAA